MQKCLFVIGIIIISPILMGNPIGGNEIDTTRLSTNQMEDYRVQGLGTDNATQWNDDPIQTEINTTGIINQTEVLRGETILETEILDQSSHLKIENQDIFHDYWEYDTSFSQYLEQGVWTNEEAADLVSTGYSNTTGITSFNIDNADNEIIYTISQSTVIPDETYIDIDVNRLNFALNDQDAGSLMLTFDFDKFDINVELNASTMFEESYSNTSKVFFLVREHLGRIRLNLSTFSELSATNFPLLLNEVKLQVYKSPPFDLELDFSRISLMIPKNQVMAVIDGNQQVLESEVSMDVNAGQQLSVGIAQNWISTTTLTQHFNPESTWGLELQAVDDDLRGKFNITLVGLIQGAYYLYNLGEILANYSISTTTTMNSNGTHLSFHYDEPVNLGVIGDLILLDTLNLETRPMQGYQLILDNIDRDYQAILLGHLRYEEIYSFDIPEEIVIPQNWSRGQVYGWLVIDNGSYYKFQASLEESPATLVSQRNWQIHQTNRNIIPVELQNITSQEVVLPQQIRVSTNETDYTLPGEYGIVIEPGDFTEGMHIIGVNASYPGFVPVIYEVSLYVAAIEITPDFLIQDQTSNSTRLQVIIPEIDEWDVGVRLLISEDDVIINETMRGSEKLLIIHHEEGVVDTMQLNITIKVDQGLAEFSYGLELYLEHGEGGSISFGMLIAGVGISSSATLIYQRLKSNDTGKIIEF